MSVRDVRFFLAVLMSLVILEGCTKEIRSIAGPANAGVDVKEIRVSGAGPAPDSLKIFLTKRGSGVASSDKPIFEAQDAGLVCYQWVGAKELQIRLADGYVDKLESVWRDETGNVIVIRYLGNNGCK